MTSVSDMGASLVAVSQTTSLQTLAAYDALNRAVAVVWLGVEVAAETLPAGSGSVVFTAARTHPA